MPSTFAAVAVALLAVAPGALYIWGFERQVGAWGINLTDRILRFVVLSAIAHAVLFPLSFHLWSEYVRSGRLASGDIPIFGVWPLLIAYVTLPLVLGSLIGRGTMRQQRWATWFTGLDPAPRAWDYLFGFRPRGWVRLRLKSGTWIAGAYAEMANGRRSYVSGYPEDQEIFLARVAEVDGETGRFLRDPQGNVRLRQSGVLIRWNEIEYLEFIEV